MQRKVLAAACVTAAMIFFPTRETFAAPVLLSDLISGNGSVTAGGLTFGGFFAAPQDTVDPATVEVSAIIDGLGRAGLHFSSPLAITNGGGSKEIVADFLFTVSETTPTFTLHDLTQSIATNVSGSGITAFDFTRSGPSQNTLSTLAANCFNGDIGGCPQIISPIDTGLLGNVDLDEIEREVQLVRGRGGNGTGDLTAWDIVFGQTSVVASVPEPSSPLLMIAGMFGVLFALRRRAIRARCASLQWLLTAG